MTADLQGILDHLGVAPPAVLAGAGISLAAPSNLLGGQAFMEAILSRVMPPEVDRATALSLINPPQQSKYRLGEYVRFETLMGELIRCGLDNDLHVLDCLDACEQPNQAHYVLAALLRRGAVVVTTNFDRLIEIAYGRTAPPGELPLRIAFTDEHFPPAGPPPDVPPTLWKIHGSLSVAGRPMRDSLQATIHSIMTPVRNQNRQRFLEAILRHQDLLILGYSGGDDLDIVPILADAEPEHAIWWVNHSSTMLNIESAASLAKRLRVPTPLETIGRDRALLERGLAELELGVSRTIRLDVDTDVIITHLRDAFCDGIEFPSASQDYQFGARHSPEVERYFDHWSHKFDVTSSAAYKLALNLFHLRGFRPSEGRLRQGLATRYRALVHRSDATPGERLEALALAFNESDHPDPPTAASNETNVALLKEIEEIQPLLVDHQTSSAHRLAACALWNARQLFEAENRFRMARDIECARGDIDGEVFTLTTWQKATNSIRDHLSFEDHKHANQVAEVLGMPMFPDEAFYRLQELAEHTGLQLHLFDHILAGLELGFAEENGERRLLLHQQLRRAARAAVDVGDVISEGKARFYTGVSFFDVGQYDDAVIELAATQELSKVAPLGDLGERATHLISVMGLDGVASRLAPLFRQTLWA